MSHCDVCERTFVNGESLVHYEGMFLHTECLKKFKNDSAGRIHECPKCKGRGEYGVKYDAYPRGLPDSGWAEDWQTKYVHCDICDGYGATKDEFVPIYEIKDYKLK